METTSNWFVWAILSAVFAALTAIFAKLGLQGVNAESRHAHPHRRHCRRAGRVRLFRGKWTNPFQLSSRTCDRRFVGLLLPRAESGRRVQVAPVDKFSLLLVVLFAVVFLKVRPALREWIGILMVGVGVVILAFKR